MTSTIDGSQCALCFDPEPLREAAYRRRWIPHPEGWSPDALDVLEVIRSGRMLLCASCLRAAEASEPRFKKRPQFINAIEERRRLVAKRGLDTKALAGPLGISSFLSFYLRNAQITVREPGEVIRCRSVKAFDHIATWTRTFDRVVWERITEDGVVVVMHLHGDDGMEIANLVSTGPRRRGLARRAFERICEAADLSGCRLFGVVEPNPGYDLPPGPSADELLAFYQPYGFEASLIDGRINVVREPAILG